MKCIAEVSVHYEAQLAQHRREMIKMQGELEALRHSINHLMPKLTSPQPTRHKRPRVSATPTLTYADALGITTNQTASATPTEVLVTTVKTTDPISRDAATEPTAIVAKNTVGNSLKAPSPQEIREKDKINKRETLTVICSKIPEPKSNSLATRREEELKSWQEMCSKMGIDVAPVTLTRLTRKKDSPHINEPRLLRVTLRNMTDVETILLASHLLKGTEATRIHPDVPWTERTKRGRIEPKEANMQKNQRSILIHGIPELGDEDDAANHLHACGEWSYIQQLLELDDVLATDIYRIPRSPNYKGTAPRLLKVTLLTQEMLTTTLDTWYHKKQLAPELRLRPMNISTPTNIQDGQHNGTHLPRSTTILNRCASEESMEVPSRNNATTTPKNVHTPVGKGPANPLTL